MFTLTVTFSDNEVGSSSGAISIIEAIREGVINLGYDEDILEITLTTIPQND